MNSARQDETPMSDIPPIHPAGPIPHQVAPRSYELSAGRADPADDQIEISPTGQVLSSIPANSGIRVDRVAEIRQAIADGSYETRARIEITVDRLLEALRSTTVGA